MFTKLADAVADRVIIKLAQLQEYQAQVAAAAELQAQGALQTKTAAYQQAMIKRAAQRKLLKLIKQAGAKEVLRSIYESGKAGAGKAYDAAKPYIDAGLAKAKEYGQMGLDKAKEYGQMGLDKAREYGAKGKAYAQEQLSRANDATAQALQDLSIKMNPALDQGPALADALKSIEALKAQRLYSGLGGAGLGLAGGLGLGALLDND